MPSLDGYSLNEEIKKLRKEVFEEISQLREGIRDLYNYLVKIDDQQVKEVKNATKKRMQQNKGSSSKKKVPSL